MAEEISGTVEAEMDRLRARTIEAEYRELLLRRDNERMARHPQRVRQPRVPMHGLQPGLQCLALDMEGGTPMIWLEWAWWLFRAAMITVGMWTSLNWIRDEIPRWRHRRYVWICGRIHEQGGRREFRSRFLFVARFRLWLHQSIRRCKPWPLEKPTEP
jgi:hypothetical protein